MSNGPNMPSINKESNEPNIPSINKGSNSKPEMYDTQPIFNFVKPNYNFNYKTNNQYLANMNFRETPRTNSGPIDYKKTNLVPTNPTNPISKSDPVPIPPPVAVVEYVPEFWELSENWYSSSANSEMVDVNTNAIEKINDDPRWKDNYLISGEMTSWELSENWYNSSANSEMVDVNTNVIEKINDEPRWEDNYLISEEMTSSTFQNATDHETYQKNIELENKKYKLDREVKELENRNYRLKREKELELEIAREKEKRLTEKAASEKAATEKEATEKAATEKRIFELEQEYRERDIEIERDQERDKLAEYEYENQFEMSRGRSKFRNTPSAPSTVGPLNYDVDYLMREIKNQTLTTNLPTITVEPEPEPLPDPEILEVANKRREHLVYNGICGFSNLGNTCYMNALIQALNSVPNLMPVLKKYSETVIKKAMALCPNESTIHEMLLIIIQKMNETNSIIRLINFKALVGKCNDRFNNYRQQDSSEFLDLIIDRLDTETSRENTKYIIGREEAEEFENYQIYEGLIDDENNQVSQAETKNYLNMLRRDMKLTKISMKFKFMLFQNNIRKMSMVYDSFTNYFIEKLTCEECGYEGCTIGYRTSLSLVIPPTLGDCSFEQCLAHTFRPNILTGDEKYKCPVCRKKVFCATKQDFLYQSSDILIIQFLRFERNVYTGEYDRKNNTKVTFPIEELTLSSISLSDDLLQKPIPKYKLNGIVIHKGGVAGGHYVCLARNQYNGKWYKYDDTDVFYVENIDDAFNDAYMLFYSKID